MTKLPHLQWHFGLISWRKATLTTAAHQAWKKDLNREKESPLLMSSESFLSIAEIKTIKCIQRLRDLILNFIFLLHCWWNYKGTISKKKPNSENLFVSTACIVAMLEIKNVGMVFCASFNERLSKEMLLRSNILQFLLCWWSHGDISFFPLIVIFFLNFSLLYFILSFRKIWNICNNTYKSVFTPNLAVTSVTCTDSQTQLG